MRYTQIVLLEAPGGCNMAREHPLCPALTLGRDKPCDHPIDPAVAASMARELWDMDFRGYYAFHWFSEPTTAMPWVSEAMAEIRRLIPEARFLLWTNGKALKEPGTWPWVAGFDRVSLSNYGGDSWDGLEHALGRRRKLVVNDITFEPRVIVAPQPAGVSNKVVCRRGYIELTIARDGGAYLCCQAWRPEQCLGNVFKEGLAECVRRYRTARDEVGLGKEPLPAGHVCLGCARADPMLGAFECTIAGQTQEFLDRA
jgi:hypothetical protein